MTRERGDKTRTMDKKWFKVISQDQFQRVRFALGERDYEDVSKILRTCKMTKERYYILCRDAIDMNEIPPLKLLLDSYPSFWTQELFDMIANYMMTVKSFSIANFVDEYIDNVNDYNKSIDDWNQHVRDKKNKVSISNENVEIETKTHFQKILTKIHNIFVKK